MPRSIRTMLPRPRRAGRLRPSKPSTWLPSIGHRQNEAFRNIWQALRQYDHLVPGTPPGGGNKNRAGEYVVCAIRLPQDPSLLSAIEPLRTELSRLPFVELTPPGSLAITIQELGYLTDGDPQTGTGDTNEELIQEFVRNATVPVCDFPQCEITIGGFNSFLDTPFLDVHDDGWCYRIHHRLRDFTLLPLDDSYAYLPHVPLGYYTHQTPMGDFPARMAKWRDRTFGSFRAESVDVLAMSTSNPLAEPRLLHRFELGHSLNAAETINKTAPVDTFP